MCIFFHNFQGLASSIYMKTESFIEILNQKILSSRMKPGRSVKSSECCGNKVFGRLPSVFPSIVPRNVPQEGTPCPAPTSAGQTLQGLVRREFCCHDTSPLEEESGPAFWPGPPSSSSPALLKHKVPWTLGQSAGGPEF